ncbi:GAF domain-containing protein [Solirubrobacter ginsenosidimutans]|uniref:histidine kinase n=1 Tax=Solirubrobacter ginsenosidimutans TaxID=490573 RepID=A0A9X3N2L0_9ACTN|nr:GAF domain-containing protein [Solirubrobacter ginsenosidimutans]MDA0167245.1 GAF domain-containing protein [Solirubrobacter ginsenosidimutans]
MARGTRQAELFAAVLEEIGQLFAVDLASICRYDADGMLTWVANWGTAHEHFPVGSRRKLGGGNIGTIVFETGRSARIDHYVESSSGPIGVTARQAGINSSLGAPIVVQDRLWGVIAAGSLVQQLLPPDTEERLASFTELVAMAISNTESRAALARLAEEQAALRRVATLVAHGAQPEDVFAAVVDEVMQLFPVDYAGLARYEPNHTATAVAARGTTHFPVGSSMVLGGKNTATRVFETGRPIRIDGYADASGPMGDSARGRGVGSSVAAPIIVEGRVWGIIGAGSIGKQSLPTHTEARLADFTEMVGTAIANAESRAGLARLAEEQAALRRVATLVAHGEPPEEVFAAVASEVALLLSADLASVMRYESDDTVTLVAGAGNRFPVGSRWPIAGQSNLATLLSETGRPARLDNYAEATGPLAEDMRQEGIRSAVGTPIIVEDRLWGLISVGSGQESALPPDTEMRLGSFTELVATAIANTESRTEVGRLVDEQTALRRVATLVAREAVPHDVFAAVAEEAGRVLHFDQAAVFRFEDDGSATLLADSGTGGPRIPLGTRISLEGDNVAARVMRTGRSARIDGYAAPVGPLAERGRRFGMHSVVGGPVVVDGRLWGAMVAGTAEHKPLPADAESRIAQFTELVATAISNVDARSDLAASRARIAHAADEERRRVVRDLHDGAQQRLVHTIITLKMARGARENEDEEQLSTLLDEALEQAEQATSELRELAHGILPTDLTEDGLYRSVQTLAARAPMPVENAVSVGRLPPAIEAAAYFVVAEALTNVAKHARALSATVTARIQDGTLRLQVHDDGVGGARPDGTGLLGLADRLAVLNGQLRIESPADGGTLITAEIPIPHTAA